MDLFFVRDRKKTPTHWELLLEHRIGKKQRKIRKYPVFKAKSRALWILTLFTFALLLRGWQVRKNFTHGFSGLLHGIVP